MHFARSRTIAVSNPLSLEITRSSQKRGQWRERFWAHLSEVRREWIEAPPVLVEMSNAQVRRTERDDFEGLPEGVELAAGSIVVRFSDPEEAFQKLMALALAISQNRPDFDQPVNLLMHV